MPSLYVTPEQKAEKNRKSRAYFQSMTPDQKKAHRQKQLAWYHRNKETYKVRQYRDRANAKRRGESPPRGHYKIKTPPPQTPHPPNTTNPSTSSSPKV